MVGQPKSNSTRREIVQERRVPARCETVEARTLGDTEVSGQDSGPCAKPIAFSGFISSLRGAGDLIAECARRWSLAPAEEDNCPYLFTLTRRSPKVHEGGDALTHRAIPTA